MAYGRYFEEFSVGEVLKHWPGRTITETDCRQAFDAYVRQPPPPGIGVDAIGPRAETWYTGFHFLICTAEADREGNVLTGSVRKPA